MLLSLLYDFLHGVIVHGCGQEPSPVAVCVTVNQKKLLTEDTLLSKFKEALNRVFFYDKFIKKPKEMNVKMI